MKSIGIATVIFAIAITLSGCKNRKQEPIPGPRATQSAAELTLGEGGSMRYVFLSIASGPAHAPTHL